MALIIKDCNLIDGTGNSVVKNQSIRVEDGKIAWIGKSDDPQFSINEEDQVITIEGSTVMPGMMDTHIHITQGYEVDQSGFLTETIPFLTVRAIDSCEKILQSGFTTVRNMGTYGFVDVAMKNAFQKGMIAGPRMIASGEMLMSTVTGELGYLRHGIDIPDMKSGIFSGADEARKAARYQFYHGADVIKLIASGRVGSDAYTLPWDTEVERSEIKAITDEAHRLHRKVAAHAYSPESVRDCVLEGIDSIEHGVMIDLETIKLMADNGTFLVPTMNAFNSYLQPDAEQRYPQYRLNRGRPMATIQRNNFEEYLKNKLPIAVGSDGPRPGSPPGSNAREIELLVSAGMDNLSAINSATLKSAELLGIDKELGSIEVGKTADIILVDGNPEKDISILKDIDKIKVVIIEGKVVKDISN